MALVKVRNRNTYPFTQKFKGKEVTIQPNGTVQMEFEDAVEFRGAFSPIKRDKDGNPHPSSYKMIEIEAETLIKPVTTPQYIHPMTGKRYASQKALDAALDEDS